MSRFAAVFAALLASGCAANLQGMVEKRPLGIWLQTPEGAQYQLVLPPEQAPMVGHLEGLIIEVRGRRIFRKVTVADWSVREGAHDLQTWVGIVEQRGVQIGMQDRNSGGYYFVDRDSVETLRPFVGKPVLLEGYVEGAHQVVVMYYRPLFREGEIE